MKRFEGKTIMVTGAGKNIGREIALDFAREGANVVICDYNEENAKNTAADIEALGVSATLAVCDVRDRKKIFEYTNEAIKKFGKIDVLVNNAGGSAALLNKLTRFVDAEPETLDFVVDTNLKGTFHCTQAVLKSMIKNKYGKIINISSIAAVCGLYDRVDYAAAKAGMIGMTKALAKQGIKIAVCDINTETIEKTVKSIEEIGGEAKGYVFDVTDSKDVDRVVNEIVKDFGSLDIMVHIAGGSARIAGPDAKYAPLVEQEDYVIDRVLKVNLYGAFWASRAAARVMIKQGTGGKIINFSSSVGLNGLANCCDYAASKGGVISLTKALAKELGPHKINVNSVAPGVVMRPEENGGSDRALKTNLLGEKCDASDIANLVEFLVSDKAKFITGQTYVCDGGRTLSMKGTD